MTKSKNMTQAASIQSLNARVDRLMKMVPKGTFRNVGSAAGMALGGPAGAAAGRVIGAGLSAITGYGDYEVSMNSLNKVSTSVDTVPAFVRNDHSVRVLHREYVRDLVVPDDPSGFHNDAQPINPSNSQLFPWLASMARQYQQYRIHGMIVEYKTMSSDYAASGPLGTVCVATNYNVLDNPYATKIALENSEFAVSCKPSMSLIHAIECDPKVTGRDILYVRDKAAESDAAADARLYDAGLLQVATAGLPGTPGSTLGEVWISYDIEFYKPVLASGNVVPGYALTSQPDGTVSAKNGEITRVIYDAVSQALTASAVTPIYNATAAAPTVSGDTGLDDTACSLAANGTLTFRRNGTFNIIWNAYATTEATKTVVATLTGGLNAPDAQFVVPGTAGTISTAHMSGTVIHGAPQPKTNYPVACATVEVTITGMPDGSTATIVCPSYTAWSTSGSLVTMTACRAVVTWTQATAANIVTM